MPTIAKVLIALLVLGTLFVSIFLIVYFAMLALIFIPILFAVAYLLFRGIVASFGDAKKAASNKRS